MSEHDLIIICRVLIGWLLMVIMLLWICSSKEVTCQNSTFGQWLGRLDAVGYKYGCSEYGVRLSEQTGVECWFYYYCDEYSPEEAFIEDCSS